MPRKKQQETRARPADTAQLSILSLSGIRIPTIILTSGILSGISFLFSGFPFFGDVWPHLVRVQITYEALRNGHLPGWTFFFYNGYPLLRFYGPLFYYLVAPFCFLTGGNPFAAVKIVLFLLHIVSGFTIYYLARRVFSDTTSALVAAGGYLFSYWHLMFVIGFGQYPAGLIFALIPLTLWLLDRVSEKPDLSRVIWTGIGMALLPLTHVFYTYFWIPFLIIWFFALPRPATVAIGKRLLAVAAAAIIAFLLGACFIVPFFVEGIRYRMPSPVPNTAPPSVLTLLGLSQQMSGYSGSYIGLGILLLAAIGIINLFRQQRLLSNAVFLGFLLAIALAFSGNIPLMSRIPLIGDLPAERFLIFALLFAVLLAGYGYRFLCDRFAVDWLWLPILALLFLDMSPRMFYNVYRPAERLLESREYVYRKLYGKRDGRLLDVAVEGRDPSRRLNRYPANAYLFAGVPVVFGPPYYQFAPKSMLYAYAWADDIAQEFLDSTQEALSNRALCELRLLAAKYIVTLPTHKGSEEGVTYVFLKKGLIWDDTLLRQVISLAERQETAESDSIYIRQPFAIGTFENLTPVVVAPRLVPWPAREYDTLHSYYIASDWQEVVDAYGLDPMNGVAEQIPIRSRLPEEGLQSAPIPALHFTMNRFRLEHELVELVITVNNDCYARLAFSYYPELLVSVDDRPVPVMETADHFCAIRLPRGQHTVIIKPVITPLRQKTAVLSGLALLGCVIGLAAVAVTGQKSAKRLS